jgi:hypothetical protein
VLVLVVVLIATNALTLAALALVLSRPPARLVARWKRSRQIRSDPEAAAALDRTPAPPGPRGSTRRLISVEILNPVELAGTRSRWAGIAGALLPGLTRRIVYDQTLRILKQQLADQQVLADVRIHTLRPAPPATRVRSGTATSPGEPTATFTDEIEQVDLAAVEAPADDV